MTTNFTLMEIGSPLKNLPNELWNYIHNTNERYLISTKGRLMTTKWKNTKANVHAIMKPGNYQGYLSTIIIINGQKKNVRLNRLVAESFIPNPENKPQVNHIDFIRSNNFVENLEWTTGKENTQHSLQASRLKGFTKGCKQKNPSIGEKVWNSVLTEKQVLEIREKFKPRIYTRDMLALEYGVKACTIKDVVLRKSWTHI